MAHLFKKITGYRSSSIIEIAVYTLREHAQWSQ